ncbi:unnamed protein product [Durusdinium trenchii]|uniref:peptidylprolyl isomerase n=1 Tax=Durusdinium trenchii TaxID=1381693 RepID=A0ABP0I1I0_9DINO
MAKTVCFVGGTLPAHSVPKSLKYVNSLILQLEEPSCLEALLQRGLALLELGRPSAADHVLREGLQADGSAVLARSAPESQEVLDQLETYLKDEALLQQVQKLRETGNEHVRQGRYADASWCYEDCLQVLWGKDLIFPSEVKERAQRAVTGLWRQIRAAETAVLTNLSLCCLQGEVDWAPSPERAMQLCEIALTYDPDHVKAMRRMAHAFMALQRYEDAEAVLTSAARKRPQDASLRQDLKRAQHRADEVRRKARDWEREAFRDLFERLPGFATPEACNGEDQEDRWPETQFPTPQKCLGTQEVQDYVTHLSESLQQEGEAAYMMELLYTIRHAVEMQWGSGSGKQLPRIVPLVQALTRSMGVVKTHEPGKAIETEPEHTFDAIPMKPLEGTKVKTAIEVIKYVPEHGLDVGILVTLINEKKFNQLPGPLALQADIPIPFAMQMVFRKLSVKEYQVLRHFTFDQKLDVRLLKSAVSGDLYILDYGKNFRNGQAGCQLLLEKFVSKKIVKAKEKSALELGFDYIKTNGPRSNMGNRQTEWAEIETHREGSPIFGWTAGLVKESLRGYANSNIFVEPTHNYFPTMHDLSNLFLEEVLCPLLPDMKTKTLVMLGNAGAGKTPAAQAIAMAFSEYWILRAGHEHELRPSFRLSNSLENLRGEPGLRERPDILDDSDMSNIPLPKVKAFLDSSLAETFTVERWTATKFVLNQLRVICDNRVHAEAEEGLKIGQTEIPFHVFMDYIKTAFHEKAQREDIQACLKRSHFILNMNEAIYVRPAGAGELPVRIVRYPETDNREVIKDFIAPEGKPIIAQMMEGNPTPPSNWLQKRQWCHDLLTYMIETNNLEIPPARTIRGRSLFGGTPSIQESTLAASPEHAFDRPGVPFLQVKQEPSSPDRARFPALKRMRTSEVISLDTPSPAKRCCASSRFAEDDDDGFPQPGDLMMLSMKAWSMSE